MYSSFFFCLFLFFFSFPIYFSSPLLSLCVAPPDLRVHHPGVQVRGVRENPRIHCSAQPAQPIAALRSGPHGEDAARPLPGGRHVRIILAPSHSRNGNNTNKLPQLGNSIKIIRIVNFKWYKFPPILDVVIVPIRVAAVYGVTGVEANTDYSVLHTGNTSFF